MATALSKKDPRDVGGRYDLVARLGHGGAGAVYQATDRTTGGTVAVKVLNSVYADDPTIQSRFAQEFEAAARLDHPNIVRVLDFGAERPRPYLVMEYVEGRSLTDLIEEAGRMAEAA